MADQGRWFKLWVSAPSDPDLANLSLEDFGRWCLFGAYLKVHGEDGRLTIKTPAHALQTLFRVPSFEAVVKVLRSFPNCQMRGPVVTVPTSLQSEAVVRVEWSNWQKYQIDDSSDRVRKWREKKRGLVTDDSVSPVTPIEEKRSRRDEMRREVLPPVVPHGGLAVEILTWLNTKAEKNFRPSEVNLALIRARLKDGVEPYQLKAIISRKVREWQGTEQAKYLRPATLFNKTKCGHYLGDLPLASPDGDAN